MSTPTSDQQIQTALYLYIGLTNHSPKHQTLGSSHIAMLAYMDEGVMTFNSALARISAFITELWYENPEPAPDGLTVFEDLVQDKIAKALLELEVGNTINRLPDRKQKWKFFKDMAFCLVSHWFDENDFDVAEFAAKYNQPKYTIRIEYFKPSGKFYAEGFFRTAQERWLDVRKELEFRLANHSPGLSGFNEQFMVYMNSDDHPMAFPIIRHPKK